MYINDDNKKKTEMNKYPRIAPGATPSKSTIDVGVNGASNVRAPNNAIFDYAKV